MPLAIKQGQTGGVQSCKVGRTHLLEGGEILSEWLAWQALYWTRPQTTAGMWQIHYPPSVRQTYCRPFKRKHSSRSMHEGHQGGLSERDLPISSGTGARPAHSEPIEMSDNAKVSHESTALSVVARDFEAGRRNGGQMWSLCQAETEKRTIHIGETSRSSMAETSHRSVHTAMGKLQLFLSSLSKKSAHARTFNFAHVRILVAIFRQPTWKLLYLLMVDYFPGSHQSEIKHIISNHWSDEASVCKARNSGNADQWQWTRVSLSRIPRIQHQVQLRSCDK